MTTFSAANLECDTSQGTDVGRQPARGHDFFSLSGYLFLAERPATTLGGSL